MVLTVLNDAVPIVLAQMKPAQMDVVFTVVLMDMKVIFVIKLDFL